MPVHIGELNTKVTVVDGELPLTERQIDALVTIVVTRLDELNRAASERRREQSIRSSVIPGARREEP